MSDCVFCNGKPSLLSNEDREKLKNELRIELLKEMNGEFAKLVNKSQWHASIKDKYKNILRHPESPNIKMNSKDYQQLLLTRYKVHVDIHNFLKEINYEPYIKFLGEEKLSDDNKQISASVKKYCSDMYTFCSVWCTLQSYIHNLKILSIRSTSDNKDSELIIKFERCYEHCLKYDITLSKEMYVPISFTYGYNEICHSYNCSNSNYVVVYGLPTKIN